MADITKDARVYSVPPDTIKVGERWREEVNQADIDAMAESIKEFGQINPITVDAQDRLVAGFHRLEATKLLGIKVECIHWFNLSEKEKRRIELEENIRRAPLTHIEELRAIEELHSMQVEDKGQASSGKGKGGHSIKDTADQLGRSKTVVAGDLELAELLKVMPQLANTKNKQEMWSIVRAARREVLEAELVKRGQDELVNATEEEKKAWLEATNSVHNAGVVEWLSNIKDGKLGAELVVTDPPYGIELADQKKTRDNIADLEGIYDDSERGWMDLMEGFLRELHRASGDWCHLYIFHGYEWHLIKYLHETLTKHGWKFDSCPLIWAKVDFPGQTRQPDFNAGRCWEPFTFAHKGEVPLAKKGQPNIFLHQPPAVTSRIHPTEKPVGLLREIIERSARDGITVFDGFAGSGSTLMAARDLGYRFIGVEKETKWANAASLRLVGDILSATDVVGILEPTGNEKIDRKAEVYLKEAKAKRDKWEADNVD